LETIPADSPRIATDVAWQAAYTARLTVKPSIWANVEETATSARGALGNAAARRRKLAQAIYEERAFDRLAILADALEEAGCTDAEVLAHCRGGGEHVLGCWVVDCILGKK
jgi:hypothetical protein